MIKEVVTTFYRPDLFGDVDDKVTEHLKGAESRFSVGERAKRLAITGVVTVGFFAIATLNVLAAVVVIYPAAVYALGVRDRRAIATSTALLVGFVYLVFVVIIEMPLDLF
ncbi:hypothetical protein [Halobellus sp. GM3]|uniref:hypothetical protein n=1 Tax=Halobellus sp. GM3 TaxID=3458410 RepID=UPI00403D8886